MKPSRIINLSLVFVLLLHWSHARAQDQKIVIWQVSRYDMAVNLPAATTGERVMTARATLSARNVGQIAGQTFTVRLNQAAEVTAASVDDAPARFVKREEARTKLQQVTLTLPSALAPGATLNARIEYRLPLNENSGAAAISAEGAQFLPASAWYPTPNTAFSARGIDAAPMRLTVNAANGESVVSAGQLIGATSAKLPTGATFDVKLTGQPFFLTGKWEAIEGSGDAQGMSALVHAGASADDRRGAESLVGFAAAARAFYASLLGPAPDAPVRLVAVWRGAGFDMDGTVLLDNAAFHRGKIDAVTSLLIAESVARLWIGGATPVRGEGAGVIREGLSRFLATLFLEKQFGRDAADAERLRERIAYAAIAKLDSPLSRSTSFDPSYYTSVADKGAMVWRLADRALGREAFLGVMRAQLQGKRDSELALAALRAALVESGGAPLKSLLDSEFDQTTQLDLLAGLPQQRAGEWVAALRNTGELDLNVPVAATTESGERLRVDATIPARDFGEARFKTTARLARVEIDPDKFYPQLDYSNDIAPRAPAPEESLAEATRLLGAQDYARAETTARDLFQRFPLMQEARILLARSLLGENKTDEAAREFRATMDDRLPMPATLAWGNIGLGEIALRKGQATEAAKRFDEAVRDDAGYAPTLAARAARVKADTASGASAPPIDEAVRAFAAQLDQAIRSGRKADLDALIMPGELVSFAKGIVGTQPEQWQTRVLHTESRGGDRLAADVNINARTLGKDQSGTAVLVLARTGNGLRLVDIPIFEVR